AACATETATRSRSYTVRTEFGPNGSPSFPGSFRPRRGMSTRPGQSADSSMASIATRWCGRRHSGGGFGTGDNPGSGRPSRLAPRCAPTIFDGLGGHVVPDVFVDAQVGDAFEAGFIGGHGLK